MLAAGAWSNPLTDWSERGGDGDGDSFIENIGGFSDEGSQHVGLNNLNYIWIDTGVAWEAETTYNLKVAVGNRGGQTGAENATVYALLSGTDNLGLATAADTAAVLTDPLLIASETYNVVGNVSAGSFGDPQVLSFNSGDTPPTGTIVFLRPILRSGGVSRWAGSKSPCYAGVRFTRLWERDQCGSYGGGR